MIRPRIVPHAPVNLAIGVSRTLGAELPDGPVLAVLVVEELDEGVERVAVGALRVRPAGARRRDDVRRHVAEIEAGFWVARAGARDDLAEERRHCVCCCVLLWLLGELGKRTMVGNDGVGSCLEEPSED